jgi:hypothetical protein
MPCVKRSLYSLPWLLLPACSFLLDFDELQSEDEKSPGGDAGTACAAPCDDQKPCTKDSCDLSSSPPRCKYEPIQGLVDDGFDAEIQADTVHRATLISAGDAFYFTVFETTNARNELTLYRVRNASNEYEKLTSFSGLLPNLLTPRSAAGLVADTSNTSVGLVLHGFLALDDNVYHIRLGGNFDPTNAPLTTLATNTYDSLNPRRYPVAGPIAGSIVGAWINKDGTITAASPGKPSVALGSTAVPATQLALIGSRDTPGVLWTGPGGVYTQIAGGPPSQLMDCETRAGIYTNAMAVSILSGFWLTSWTKAGLADGGFVSSQQLGVGCGSPLCVAGRQCDGDILNPGVRNPAAATASRAGDPIGTVFVASANPYIRLGDAGAPETGINLVVARIDFGDPPFQRDPEAVPIGTVELSNMPAVAPLFDGPDWPAISILPPNRVGVVWSEPRQAGQVLRAKRLMICAP